MKLKLSQCFTDSNEMIRKITDTWMEIEIASFAHSPLDLRPINQKVYRGNKARASTCVCKYDKIIINSLS